MKKRVDFVGDGKVDRGENKVFIIKSGLAGAWFIITIVSDCFHFRF